MLLVELSREVIEFATEPILALPPIVIPLIMLGISVVGAIVKGQRAKKQRKAAEKAIANYKRQKLKNVYEHTSFTNQAARDHATMMINKNTGNALAAAKQGGARTTGVAVAAQTKANEAALKQEAIEQKNYMTFTENRARGEDRKQTMQENREQQDINGLGRLYAMGVQGENQAISEGFEGASQAAGAYGGSAGTKSTYNPQAKY